MTTRYISRIATGCSILLLGALSGCAYFFTNDTVPNDPALQTCSNLREQIISNNYVNNTPDRNGGSPTKNAALYKEYARNNCSKLVDSNTDSPLPADYK